MQLYRFSYYLALFPKYNSGFVKSKQKWSGKSLQYENILAFVSVEDHQKGPFTVGKRDYPAVTRGGRKLSPGRLFKSKVHDRLLELRAYAILHVGLLTVANLVRLIVLFVRFFRFSHYFSSRSFHARPSARRSWRRWKPWPAGLPEQHS
jgi:hypothetical protein